MLELLKFMFQSFWHFVGCALLLSGGANLIFLMWNRFWRHWSIRKNGYPPPHCDADGDFKSADKEAS
jgi:D-alanyl-lipoteichoic acid acyltransferase DltB (MBOAT superfamily)